MTKDQQVKLVDAAAKALGEHYDAVQILVSLREDSGDTSMIYSGVGNWFARQGMAHDFIGKDEARTSAQEIGNIVNPPDDSESWKQV